MKNLIYYFTGTGNCLAIARKIETAMEECAVVPMAGIINKNRHYKDFGVNGSPESERIGVVFPTFAYGLPNMVKDFLRNAEFDRNAYFFAVTSNFGIPGTTLNQADRLLKKRGCRLDAGFAVLGEHASSLIDDPKDLVQRFMISLNNGRKPRSWSERQYEIVRTVKEKSPHPIEMSSAMVNFFGSLLHSMAIGLFNSSGKFFWTSNACVSCGICTKVCPLNNIVLKEGRPVWGGNCELCHACIQNCPKIAIQYKNLTEGKPRSRNSEVLVEDLIGRK